MGILESPEPMTTPIAAKRRSTDFSKLGPLKKFGTKGFTGYREGPTPKKKDAKADDDEMDSDPDDEDRRNDDNDDDAAGLSANNHHLSPEDARKQGELAEGVRKIKVRVSYRSLYDLYLQGRQLKRAHSAEALSDVRKSPHISNADSPQSSDSMTATAGSPLTAASHAMKTSDAEIDVSSPFKKHRASLDSLDVTKFSSFGPGASSAATQTDPLTSANPTETAPPLQTSTLPAAQIALPAIDSDEDL